jgi:hypothetical protein
MKKIKKTKRRDSPESKQRRSEPQLRLRRTQPPLKKPSPTLSRNNKRNTRKSKLPRRPSTTKKRLRKKSDKPRSSPTHQLTSRRPRQTMRLRCRRSWRSERQKLRPKRH